MGSQTVLTHVTPTITRTLQVGLMSVTTNTTTNGQAGIYGRATHSNVQNIGVLGEAQSSTTGYTSFGGLFAVYGNTPLTTYGIFSSTHNQGDGAIFGGSFNLYNLTNEGRGFKYGVSINNSTSINDTTTANGRYGLYSFVNGKSKYSSYAIYGSNYNSDTVTTLGNRYGIYAIVGGKIKVGYANYGGYFTASTKSYATSDYGIYMNAANNFNDTTTAQSRYGGYAIVNGKSRNGTFGFYADNASYNDTVTAISNNYGFYSTVAGKIKKYYTNTGGYFSANSNSYMTNVNAGYFSANNYFNDTTTLNSRYGVYASVSGKASNNCINCNAAIFATNTSFGDTITVPNKNGVYASVYGKAKYSSYGGNFSNYATGNNTQIGVNAYTNANTIFSSFGLISASNNGSSGTNYGGYFRAYGSSTSTGTQYGLYATATNDGSGQTYAAFFQGSVYVNGNLGKAGGTFKIDHPQDPTNKYLQHSFVESPEMKNIYDGVVITDINGDAIVQLPTYFNALNISFRYQLTCIGQFAQAIISEKIKTNSFKIKTDKPNIEVSWQVTGVRNDAWAIANPIVVEQEKEISAKGKYLNPEAYKQPRSMGIHTTNEVSNSLFNDGQIESITQQNFIESQQKREELLHKQHEEQRKRQEEENKIREQNQGKINESVKQ